MAVHVGSVEQALNTAKKVQEYIGAGFDTCVEVAIDLAEHDKESGESSNKALTELRDAMSAYCEMERKMNDAVQAAEAVKRQIQSREWDENVSMTTLFDDKLAELHKDSSKADPKDHHRMLEFDQRIQEASNPDEAGVPGTIVTEQVDDDEIEWVQAEVNTKCPFTGKDMTHPVTNKHCKHNYDRDGILQFIKSRGRRAKCPVGGCANVKPLEQADLEDNVELRKLIDRKNRQAGKKTKRSQNV